VEAKQLDHGIGNTFVSVGVTSALCIVASRVPSSLFTIPHHPSRTEDDAIFPAGYRHVVTVQDDADQMEAAHKIDDLRHTLFAARSKERRHLHSTFLVSSFGNGICAGNRFLVKHDRPPPGEVTEAYGSGLRLTKSFDVLARPASIRVVRSQSALFLGLGGQDATPLSSLE
jgi:hypothetical protein